MKGQVNEQTDITLILFSIALILCSKSETNIYKRNNFTLKSKI